MEKYGDVNVMVNDKTGEKKEVSTSEKKKLEKTGEWKPDTQEETKLAEAVREGE